MVYAAVLYSCNFRGYEGMKCVELDMCVHVI